MSNIYTREIISSYSENLLLFSLIIKHRLSLDLIIDGETQRLEFHMLYVSLT